MEEAVTDSIIRQANQAFAQLPMPDDMQDGAPTNVVAE